MKLDKVFLLFVPVAASSTLFTLPSFAISFTSSEASASAFLSDFNQVAQSSSVTVDASVFASSVDLDEEISLTTASEEPIPLEDSAEVNPSSLDSAAEAFVSVSALAFFPEEPESSSIVNDHENEVSGSGPSFLAQSEADTTAIANFFITPQQGVAETFSFDFTISLILETRLTDKLATASGDISIEVCSNEVETNLLFCDALSISGLVQNTGESDFTLVESGDSFTFLQLGPFEDTFPDTQELDFTAIGSFQREFTNPTFLTLKETKSTEVKISSETTEPVATPEPSSLIGVVLSAGLMIGQTNRHKSKKEAANSKKD